MNAMEPSMRESLALPNDCWAIIFGKGDCNQKQILGLVTKGFSDYSTQFFKNIGINDFIDIVYTASSPKHYLWLNKKCNDEHKVSLINYYVFKSIAETDERGSNSIWMKKSINKKIVLNNCLQFNRFETMWSSIVTNNKKNSVKYFIDYCNAWCCVELVNLDSGEKNEKIFWPNESYKELLMEHYNQNIKDMAFFGQSTKACSLEDKITEALKVKKIFILVYLSDLIEKEEKLASLTCETMKNIFINAQTDELRQLLAKSCYVYEYELKKLCSEAIKNQKRDEIKSYLEIMIDQGINCSEITIKHIFDFDLIDMLPALLNLDWVLTLPHTVLKSLTAGQIKECVKIGYALYGKNFWVRENGRMSLFLYQAVKCGDVELVKYLLQCEVDPDKSAQSECKLIWYACGNDEIFKLLIKTTSDPFDRCHCINGVQTRDVSHILCTLEECFDDLKLCEKNIIEILQQAEVQEITIRWFEWTMANGLNDAFKYLFERKKLSDGENQKCLWKVSGMRNFDLVEFLLQNNGCKRTNIDNSNYSCIQSENKKLLDLFVKYEANIFIECSDYKIILNLMNDNDIKSCYEKHKKDISSEQSKKLLSLAIKQERYDLVEYLLNEGVCNVFVKKEDNWFYIRGDYDFVTDERIKFLLFKDLVSQNKDKDVELQFLLNHAIAQKSLDMIKVVSEQYKNIKNFIPDKPRWTEKDKNIMETLIEHGFKIISLIDIARGDNCGQDYLNKTWLNVLSTEILVKNFESSKDVIVSQQVALLLRYVGSLYRDTFSDLLKATEETEFQIKTRAKIKALLEFILSLKQINIFDATNWFSDEMFLRLIDDEQVIIEEIKLASNIEVVRFKNLLTEARSLNKCKIVDYLCDQNKVSLENIMWCISKNSEMQQILEKYQNIHNQWCAQEKKLENEQKKEQLNGNVETTIKIVNQDNVVGVAIFEENKHDAPIQQQNEAKNQIKILQKEKKEDIDSFCSIITNVIFYFFTKIFSFLWGWVS